MGTSTTHPTEPVSLPAYIPTSGENATETVSTIRNGLPAEAFEWLKDRLGLSADELASLVHVSSRTMTRRKRQGRLKPDESERVLRLIRLFQSAADVLGGPEEARDWLQEKNHALGGETPLQFADTEPGARRVRRLLGQIEHGIIT